MSLVMADIDNFKQINDSFGHQTGDEVLREFAAALTRSVRETDLAARYGGEEFVVVLPGARLVNAARAGCHVDRAGQDIAPEPPARLVSLG